MLPSCVSSDIFLCDLYLLPRSGGARPYSYSPLHAPQWAQSRMGHRKQLEFKSSFHDPAPSDITWTPPPSSLKQGDTTLHSVGVRIK